MDNEKIEIKIESKSSYYLNLIKQKLITILKPVLAILILIATLYIGFYILLFVILFVGISYLFKSFKNLK